MSTRMRIVGVALGAVVGVCAFFIGRPWVRQLQREDDYARMGEQLRACDRDEERCGLVARFYERLCEEDDDEACLDLGQMIEKGRGIAKDPVRAAEMYRRVAASYEKRCERDAEACWRLGLLHEQGRGAPKDPARSAALYRGSCQRGNRAGCQLAARAAGAAR